MIGYRRFIARDRADGSAKVANAAKPEGFSDAPAANGLRTLEQAECGTAELMRTSCAGVSQAAGAVSGNSRSFRSFRAGTRETREIVVQAPPSGGSFPTLGTILRDLERELSCTEPGRWRTDSRIAARLLDRVRAEVAEPELQALVRRYVANIARGMRPAGALLQALRIDSRF